MSTTIAGTAALFIAALASMQFVQQQFFPSSDRPELLLDLTLPQGSSIGATRKVDWPNAAPLKTARATNADATAVIERLGISVFLTPRPTTIMGRGCKWSAAQINLLFARRDRPLARWPASRMCSKRLPEALENQHDRCNT